MLISSITQNVTIVSSTVSRCHVNLHSMRVIIRSVIRDGIRPTSPSPAQELSTSSYISGDSDRTAVIMCAPQQSRPKPTRRQIAERTREGHVPQEELNIPKKALSRSPWSVKDLLL